MKSQMVDVTRVRKFQEKIDMSRDEHLVPLATAIFEVILTPASAIGAQVKSRVIVGTGNGSTKPRHQNSSSKLIIQSSSTPRRKPDYGTKAKKMDAPPPLKENTKSKLVLPSLVDRNGSKMSSPRLTIH